MGSGASKNKGQNKQAKSGNDFDDEEDEDFDLFAAKRPLGQTSKNPSGGEKLQANNLLPKLESETTKPQGRRKIVGLIDSDDEEEPKIPEKQPLKAKTKAKKAGGAEEDLKKEINDLEETFKALDFDGNICFHFSLMTSWMHFK